MLMAAHSSTLVGALASTWNAGGHLTCSGFYVSIEQGRIGERLSSQGIGCGRSGRRVRDNSWIWGRESSVFPRVAGSLQGSGAGAQRLSRPGGACRLSGAERGKYTVTPKSKRLPVAVTAVSKEAATGEGSPSKERVVNIDEVLKTAYGEGEDLVFVDDGEGDVADPFAPREGSGSKGQASSLRVFPSSADISAVLSAYQEATPAFREMSVEELRDALQSSSAPMVVDVRTAEEFAQGHVPEAVNVPLPEVVSRVADGSLKLEGRQVAIICRSGRRSAQAASDLLAAFTDLPELMNVTGGTLAWINKDFPVSYEA